VPSTLLTVPSTLPQLWEGQAVGDCFLVVADPGGERVQLGLVVIGFHGGEPVIKVSAAGEVRHHLGERTDVAGEGVQVRALGADGVELGLLSGLEVVRAGQQQAGDLAGLGYRGRRLRRGACLAELREVAADGLRAAGPALPAQLGVERRGVAGALVPAAEAGLELIQLRFPGGGPDEELVDAGGAGEPLDGLAVQAGGPADRGQRLVVL